MLPRPTNGSIASSTRASPCRRRHSSGSFGGNVALAYAGLFPDHPGGVILANTTGGRSDQQRVIEAFGRLGGPEAAAVARRTYADETGDYQAEFIRVCYPLYSATPGWAGESRQFLARMIKNMDVSPACTTPVSGPAASTPGP